MRTLTYSLLAIAIFQASVAAATYTWYPFKPDPVIEGNRLAAVEAACPRQAAVTPSAKRRVLVFSRTSEFRHYEGIASTKVVIEMIGKKTGTWETVISDDLANFEADALKKFDCVVMNNTTGMPFAEPAPELEKMDAAQVAAVMARDARLRDNLIEYVRNGGGLFAPHAGVDCYRRPGQLYEPYLDMVGGDFIAHPWTSHDETVVVVEDRDSPITKGMRPEFRIKHEQYMFGARYDRTKLRVLLALDLERSPLRENARKDGDCAMAWIKDFGRGRVAYSGFGHNITPYYSADIQEMTMRLIQFAIGDLPTDTTSLPKPSLAAPAKAGKFFAKPTAEQIRALRDCDYGTATEAIDCAVFVVFNYNDDAAFCETLEAFLLEELKSGAGTARYRTMLAQMMDAVGVQRQGTGVEKLYANEKDEAVRSRLQNVVARWKDTSVQHAKEPVFTVPNKLPLDARELANLIGFFVQNPKTKLPPYLNFEALEDDAMKARLAYAMAQRGESIAPLWKVDLKTADLVLAAAYWVSQRGSAGDFGKLFTKAGLADREQLKRMAVYLSATDGINVMETLIARLGDKEPSQRTLAVEALSLMDFSEKLLLLTADFVEASKEKKLAVLTVLETATTAEAFQFALDKLPSEKDAMVRGAMQRALTRMAQGNFTDEMFTMVVEAARRSEEDGRLFYLRFAPIRGGADGLAFCERALKEEMLVSEALKALGNWPDAAACPVLVKFAREAKTERVRILAQSALVSVAERVAVDEGTLDYLVKEGVREQEREAAGKLLEKRRKK